MSDTNVHRVVGNLLVGTSHFFVDTTTNQVGINTSSPSASLDVATGDVKVGSSITLASSTGIITATGGFSGDGSGLSGVNSDSGSWVKDDTNGLIYVANSAHKVGIGTTNPATPFELVVGTDAAPLTTETTVMQLKSTIDGSTSDHACYFKFQYVPESNPVSWTDWSGRIQFVTDATNQGYIEFNPPGADYGIAFGNTGGGSAAGEIMRLLGTGNVGINKTNPGVKLDVDGDVRTSGLLTVGNYTSAPSSTLNGSIYYNNTTHELNVLANGVWSALSAFTPANITNLVGWYLPDNRSGTTWTDASTAGNNATCTSVNGPVGPSGGLRYLYGGVNSYVQFPSAILPSTYTLFHVTKYNGTNKQRIFDGKGNNWLSGFWGGRSGVAFHEGWLTGYGSSNNRHGSNWVISTDQNSLYRSYSTGTTWFQDGNTGITQSTNLGINYGNHTNSGSNSEKSDWAVAEVIVYSRTLNLDEYTLIHNYLKNKYNL